MLSSVSLKPSAFQLASYTEGAVLPKVEKIIFRPGYRGRPREGAETVEFTDMKECEKFLFSGEWVKFGRTIVRFENDCHSYDAHMEIVYEKLMMVIEGMGIVMSVVVGAVGVMEKTFRQNRLSKERRGELIALLSGMTLATKRRDVDVAKEFGVTSVCICLLRKRLGLCSVKELV